MSTAATHHPLETAGRIGYAFKGGLYVLLGALAVDTALSGGATEGRRGALQVVAESTFGGVLLTVLALGLAAYAVWRLAMAALDPEREGTDAKGLLTRAGFVISGLSYATLAVAAYQILQSGGGSGGSASEGAQTALSLPGGRFVLALVALAVAAFGAYEIVRARRGDFMEKLALSGEAARQRETVRRVGQAGLVARGVVYGVIGVALGVAAAQADPSEAVGLDGALTTLRDQPYGALLLGAVGLGLAAYGLYCGINARYRRFEGDQ